MFEQGDHDSGRAADAAAGVAAELAALGGRVQQAGLSAGTGGNISAREGSIIWMKPSGLAMDELTAANLAGLDLATGRQVHGDRAATSELNMHLGVYRARPDVQAVFHVHPPWLSGVISAGVLYRPLVSEAIFYLGRIVTIPYVTPTTHALAVAMAAAVAEGDTIMMPKHGLLATGATMRQAFHRCVVAEDSAKAFVAARLAGTPQFLTDEEIEAIRSLGA